MQRHHDGSVTLNPAEAVEHSLALSEALVNLRTGSEVARRGRSGDPFGADECQAVFVLDTSGSMAASMSGDYSPNWHESKIGQLHELIKNIMENVAVETICIGSPPDSIRRSHGFDGRIMVFEGNGMAPCYGSNARGYYGAWVGESIPAEAAGGTPLACGLQLALNRGHNDITVISDGLPQGVDLCLDLANRFQRIDAWFLGNGNSSGVSSGRDFMRRLHRGAGTFGSTNLGNENVRRRIANNVAGYLTGFGTGG